MSVDKLVDSTQLDADLTSVANAIRAKSGGSGSLAFPAGFVSEIGNISGGETVYYTNYGIPYTKNYSAQSNASKGTCSFREAEYLETIDNPYATSGGQCAWDCNRLKSVSFAKRTTFETYFIRQQLDGVTRLHSLESVTLGSIGYPVTTLGSVRWIYGDTSDVVTITIFVNASTLADIPANVSNYLPGDIYNKSTKTINIVYKNSATGEVITG